MQVLQGHEEVWRHRYIEAMLPEQAVFSAALAHYHHLHAL